MCKSCVYKKLIHCPRTSQNGKKSGGDKTQAAFNSNTEVAKKTDAGTAVLLNNPSLQFGTVRKDSGGGIFPLKSDAIALVFKWSTFMPSRSPIQNKNEKVFLTKFTII